jgi:hypothetical protein
VLKYILPAVDSRLSLLAVLKVQKMSAPVENGKRTFFGKMVNFVKTVAERAMDPDAIPSDDENDDTKSDDGVDEQESLAVDFRQKYTPGSSVAVSLEQEDPSCNVPVIPPEVGIDDLNIDALNIDAVDIESELAKEVASVDIRESTDGAPTLGFVGRSAGTTFCTRVGPNYKVNKHKALSAPALMELMSAE